MTLPESFLARPIAHRALHDLSNGRPENSREAIGAAIDAGYGIEIDLQLSGDGEAMVFHDYDLARLTGAEGAVAGRSAVELAGLTLNGGATGIPTLREVLAQVAGRVPLLIELKDQDGALGDGVGPLEAATAQVLEGYGGDVALMSFNPHSVARMADLCPHLPRGLTTETFDTVDWPDVSEARCARLTGIADYDRVRASFISHNRSDLGHPRVADLKAAGARILTWTIRNPDEERAARRIAEQITFEGYLA